MTATRTKHARTGITLVEILISILILGVGLVSLATLFPLGLLRLHAASRLTRSTFLSRAAAADVRARNLFSKASFVNTYITPWYITASGPYDPWIQDVNASTGDWSGGAYRGVGGNGILTNQAVASGGTFSQINPGPGLPVAYDPLWWMMVFAQTNGSVLPSNTQARFASGVGWVGPESGDGAVPSAHGLQRISNFNPFYTPANNVVNPYYVSNVEAIFVSPEDYLTQSPHNEQVSPIVGAIPQASPVLPELTLQGTAAYPVPTFEYRYSWMVTAQQVDSTNGTMFHGDIVIFENRPFGFEQVQSPLGGTVAQATGETVVEAIFGYSKTVLSGTGSVGYGSGANRTVLLRWPVTMPDPPIKVGAWIADVTYETSAAQDYAMQQTALASGIASYPNQRCHWYQIVKRTEPGADEMGNSGYRSITVTVHAPLQSHTLMTTAGVPVYANAALVSPHVVNVVPREFETR